MRRLLSTVVTTVLVASLTWTTTSLAAAAPASSGAAPLMCATVLERITPGRPETRVATDFCSTNEAAVRAAVPAASLVLVTFYQNYNYTGAYRSVWVPSPCDSVGYNITDNRTRNSDVGGITSLRLGNAGCTFVQAFSQTNFTGAVQSGYSGLPKISGVELYRHVWSAKMWLQQLPCSEPTTKTAC